MSTACAAWMGTAVLPSLLLTWRCHGCRRIIARLEYNHRSVIEVKHGCNTLNRLPDHADNWLRMEPKR